MGSKLRLSRNKDDSQINGTCKRGETTQLACVGSREKSGCAVSLGVEG